MIYFLDVYLEKASFFQINKVKKIYIIIRAAMKCLNIEK